MIFSSVPTIVFIKLTTFVQGFENLRPITLRNEVREIIADDEGAAVLYDFVTDTPVGPVLCAEFLAVEDVASGPAPCCSTGAAGPRCFRN